MWRWKAWLLALAATAGLAGSALLGGCHKGGGPPSVLLVTLDTTRADRLGCYGCSEAATPCIDRLAREGVRFDLAVAQAAVTPVSHASILTGLNPYQHGLRVIHGASNDRLEEGAHPTLASILAKRGYRTAAFVSAFTASEYFGLDDGFEVFDAGLAGARDEKMQVDAEGRADWDVARLQRRADETANRAIAWLREEEEPFFLWLHFFDPHDPALTPPEDFCRPFLQGKAPGEELTRALYDAEVSYMDAQLGRVIDLLRAQGRLEHTLVVVTNDHGEGLGDHDWWFHRILYQEEIRMPLILRLPGGPAGRVVPDLVRSIDIAPTLLDYLAPAAPEAAAMEGKSLLALAAGEKEPERTAYADALIRLDDNSHAFERAEYDDLLYCVMTRSWKLIHHFFHPEASELYHLAADPRETQNVIDRFPEQREALFRFLERPGVMIEKLIPSAEGDEASRRLKELGY